MNLRWIETRGGGKPGRTVIPPDTCQHCKSAKLRGFAVFARHRSNGKWWWMCMFCHQGFGDGLGQGKGILYKQIEEGPDSIKLRELTSELLENQRVLSSLARTIHKVEETLVPLKSELNQRWQDRLRMEREVARLEGRVKIIKEHKPRVESPQSANKLQKALAKVPREQLEALLKALGG